MTATTLGFVPETVFVPDRISRCAVITLDGKIGDVFPLFGPIREKEWAEGWDPEIIYPQNGRLEKNMIFRTRGNDEEPHYNWTVSNFDPDQCAIEYMVSTANRIWFINVTCESRGTTTKAEICYTYTGLNEKGNALNRKALEKMYAEELRDWERAINYYLKHKKLLRQH